MKTFLPFVLFVIFVVNPLSSPASTNVTPATGGAVPMSATSLVIRAAVLESNALARVNPPILVASPVLTNITTLTNAGWSTDGSVTAAGLVLTNGASLLSPALGSGLSAIEISKTNSYFSHLNQWSTNQTDWTTLSGTNQMVYAWTQWWFRIVCTNSAVIPPGESGYLRLNSLALRGHRRPDLIGFTNDHAGIVVRVDNPVGTRDAVNLQTLESRLAAYVPGGSSGSSWSLYQASNTVNLAGYALQLDPRYVLSVSGDTVSLTFGGGPLLDLVGASTCTPRIVRFGVFGTNLSADVVGVTGWRPYPQWSTDLVAGAWTTLATNKFTSTYPTLTNGLFSLDWNSLGYTTEYWRVTAIDETGGTNTAGLALFHVPVNVPALTVNGVPVVPGEATASNAIHAIEADHALTAGYATNAGAAATAGYATNAGAAVTAGYATNAGNSSTAGYATNSGNAATADLATYANTAGSASTAASATRAGYATNAGNSATAVYATNAGIAASATYATTAGSAGNSTTSGYATNAGYATTAGTSTSLFYTVGSIVTNLIVISTNGANYNGPPLGTVFTGPYPGFGEYWNGDPAGQIFSPGEISTNIWGASYPMSAWFWGHSYGPTGTYVGGVSGGDSGTGTFVVAWQVLGTNVYSYLPGKGTVQCERVTGPATNQWTPYISGWYGNWTSIVNNVTNVLQFNAYGQATNKLTL